MHPKKAASLLAAADLGSRKVSPAGILKPSKKFSCDPSVESVESNHQEDRTGLRQPLVVS